MRHRRYMRAAGLVLAASVALTGLAGCAKSDDGTAEGGGEGDPIVIGASLPMTGALERFGVLTQMGYEYAVDEVNADGGLDVGGEKREVELKILDDQSDPTKASENASKLILQDGAVALLGSITPPQNIPMAQVAEAQGIPLVVTGTPIRAFTGAAPEGGWTTSFVLFFDELEMTQLQFKTMDQVQTNKKVALFTDQEQDGEVMGQLWEEAAPQAGYEIAYRAKFPVGTTDYGDFIRRAQESGADILIAQMIPPDAIALWKQMGALSWKPKAAFFEKAGNSAAWWDALQTDATGTMATGWWAPELGYTDSDVAAEEFGDEAKGSVEIGQVTDAATIAAVLLDAIEAAGSTDPKAITDALAGIEGSYMAGTVDFDDTGASALDLVTLQWQEDGTTAVVFPADKSETEMIFPLP